MKGVIVLIGDEMLHWGKKVTNVFDNESCFFEFRGMDTMPSKTDPKSISISSLVIVSVSHVTDLHLHDQ